MVHKSAEQLPCRPTLRDMMIEPLTVVQAQLCEELTREEINYHTLQTDGTTKCGKHFATYDIVTNESIPQWNVALRIALKYINFSFYLKLLQLHVTLSMHNRLVS